ncbi:hypothetical protein DY000_02007536 [Brassica cretica]|uniref:Uncharacterized protein n=1 Tax=Brassica cretica TaxID=69181 RepID=A0ABQ7CA99_BRACR|nr:hypothetical protein DY000_02007537 [Brassica cretica]KAF3548164.1 hypothetical protein DY000_02007536 [Brassica cretica]
MGFKNLLKTREPVVWSSWIDHTTGSAIRRAGPVQLGRWPSRIEHATSSADGRAGSNTRPAWPSAQLDQSSSGDGRTGSKTRPARPSAELNQSSSADGRAGSNSPIRQMAEPERSCCLHPVLAVPPFGIRMNLLLFHLDRSHRLNFTI